jgi:hypothetical protein
MNTAFFLLKEFVENAYQDALSALLQKMEKIKSYAINTFLKLLRLLQKPTMAWMAMVAICVRRGFLVNLKFLRSLPAIISPPHGDK